MNKKYIEELDAFEYMYRLLRLNLQKKMSFNLEIGQMPSNSLQCACVGHQNNGVENCFVAVIKAVCPVVVLGGLAYFIYKIAELEYKAESDFFNGK